MKYFYNIFAITLVTLSFSCKNETSEKSIPETRNPMNEELTDTRNYESDGNFKEDTYTYEEKTDSINENWNLNSPERQMELYARFKMTDMQQQRYETALTKWWDSETEDSFEKHSANKRIEVESNILKNILNEDQYENYEEWADDNNKR
ncbi:MULTISPECIES: hypothetical protein [Winogradskyella]|uniref:hypothetical protein n=1 Tax=Winogradskyella TaxID=286104 RepID=UPI0015C9AC74|nr:MULTISPECIES: hypothetical protein [Winogradskyella]QXP78292.1 hypothetical protein H0I32_13865 [Winogradskyella sp. HaHa_3_26]